MRILHYEGSYGQSLSAVHAYEVWRNLEKLGHEVVFVKGPPPQPGTPSAAGDRPGLAAWTRIKRRLRLTRVFEALRGELALLYIIRREAGIFFPALRLLLKSRRGFDVIYRRHNLLNSEYFLAKLFRIPLVKEVNGIVADEMRIGNKGDRASLWVVERVERWNMARADRTIVVTSKLKQVLQDDYHLPADRIAVIWNGANTDMFRPMEAAAARKEMGLDPEGDYVCFVGSLSRWQGVENLVRSAPLVLADCPDARFLVVGGGALYEELVALAETLGVSCRFTFTGFVPYEKVPLHISASDICTAPFVADRNERIGISPLKMCEYLACGRPVVASRISGLEMLEDTRAGLLVAPEDPGQLAAAIVRLLQDAGLRETMGENGRRYVVENRSWESVARDVAELCRQLAERRGKSA